MILHTAAIFLLKTHLSQAAFTLIGEMARIPPDSWERGWGTRSLRAIFGRQQRHRGKGLSPFKGPSHPSNNSQQNIWHAKRLKFLSSHAWLSFFPPRRHCNTFKGCGSEICFYHYCICLFYLLPQEFMVFVVHGPPLPPLSQPPEGS